MERNIYNNIDPHKCPSPSFVVDMDDLETNLKILDSIQKRTGCKILLAQKGFAMFHFYPLIKQYLAGVCASGLHEAKLGREEFGKEVHTYSPAYKEDEFKEIAEISNHIIFNSFSQLNKFLPVIKKSNKDISIGIRVNPQHSETEVPIYDPCRQGSRLGVTAANFEEEQLDNISGIHFHTLCEKNADSLERTLAAIEKQFGRFFNKIKWVNFGGGHHITRDDYDIELLCKIITDFRKQYNNIDVFLEPGEAIALNTGVFV
ncbi:MAG: carboxynorspermidine decarboxylase, partial [Spirochaetaceae bacterium]|nr:carboxynorspermidine decarboxylase [Spirochaetaceae bacterium]